MPLYPSFLPPPWPQSFFVFCIYFYFAKPRCFQRPLGLISLFGAVAPLRVEDNQEEWQVTASIANQEPSVTTVAIFAGLFLP